jgi:uncharacterized delta-60 repeat protein
MGSRDLLFGIAIDGSGRIIGAGYREDGSLPANAIGLVARFNSNGSLDTTFGTGGKTDVDFGGSPDFSYLNRAVVLGDGRIVVGGFTGIARLTASGQLDPTFGNGGKTKLPPADSRYYITTFAVQSDGRIVTGSTFLNPDYSQDIKIARYTAAGQPDPSFNNGSAAKITDFGWNKERLDDITVDAQDRILIAGYGKSATTSGDWLIARFTTGGTTTTGASIAGAVFNDANGNGVRDAGEAGLGGRTVWIDLDNDKIVDSNETTTTTDASGNYKLSNLAAGTYKVRQLLPGGWAQTTPANGYGINVTIATNQSVCGKLFGARKIA